MRANLIVAMFLLSAPQILYAQSWAPTRGFIVVNGGYQLKANDFTDVATKRQYAEDGRFDSTYVVKGGPTFDIAGGGVLWGRLGVGVGISRFSVSTPSSLTATIPHLFFFNRHRSVSTEITSHGL